VKSYQRSQARRWIRGEGSCRSASRCRPQNTSRERRLVFYGRSTALQAMPSVGRSIGSGDSIQWMDVRTVSKAGRKPAPRIVSHYQFVSPTFFRTIGVPPTGGAD
jgi:hypothetical protein